MAPVTAVSAVSAPVLASRKTVAPRRNAAALPVVRVSRRTQCRASTSASAEKRELALPVGVAAGVGALMANPLVAEAAVTPSLKNLLNSIVAGGIVAAIIAGAITAISSFDPLTRK